MSDPVRYSIIIPVFNEEAVLHETYRRLTRVMQSIGEPYELLFVNDGSRDRTAELIEGFMESDERVRMLDFSRNFGHQIAITAGMDHAHGEAIVIIDADLQDPPELIPRMIDKWKEGYEVVYARRAERQGETLFKRWTAALFYRTLNALTDIDIPLDTGDFRLIDRQVCDAMRRLPEKNRFVRGLVSWVGFRQTAIDYVREERWAGESKYPLKKMLRLSLDGITSFSHQPLKLATYLGLVAVIASFAHLLVYSGLVLFTNRTVDGWVLPVDCLLLLNGLILIALGILGEYVGRIYDEAKNRPLYILRQQQPLSEPTRTRGDSEC